MARRAAPDGSSAPALVRVDDPAARAARVVVPARAQALASPGARNALRMDGTDCKR